MPAVSPARARALVLVAAALAGCGPDLSSPSPAQIEIAFVRVDEDQARQLRGFGPGQPDVALLPPEPANVGLSQLDWSHDGELLVYVRTPLDEASELYLYDPRVRSARALTPGARPAWSPVRRELAFVRELEDHAELVVIDPETELERRVGVGDVKDFDWSPQADRFVVLGRWPELDTEVALYIVDAETGEPQRIDPDPANPAPGVTQPSDSEPTWSPDGTRIAFTSAGRADQGYSSVYLIDPDGTELAEVSTDGVHGANNPSWSPSGDELAYSYWYFDAVQPGDYGVGVVGRVGLTGGRGMAWSPDGDRIAVVAYTPGLVSTWIYVATLGEDRIVPDAPEGLSGSERDPAWRAVPD